MVFFKYIGKIRGRIAIIPVTKILRNRPKRYENGSVENVLQTANMNVLINVTKPPLKVGHKKLYIL